MALDSWSDILCESLAEVYAKPIDMNSENLDKEYPLKVKRTMNAHFVCHGKKEKDERIIQEECTEDANNEICIKEESISEQHSEEKFIKKEYIKEEDAEERYIKEEIKTENIKLEYEEVKCPSHPKCGNTWSSQFGCVQFEYQVKTSPLGGLIKITEFGQSCKLCEDGYMLPSFDRQDAKAAGQKLKAKILEKFYGAHPHHTNMDEAKFFTPKGLYQPHESQNCEACRKGLCSWGGEHHTEERVLAKSNKQNKVELERNGVRIYVKWKLQVGGKMSTLGGINKRSGIKRKAISSEIKPESLKDPRLLKCTVCGDLCKRAATLSCCKAPCCRMCGFKKMTLDKECWMDNCGAQDLRTDRDLVNDNLLRDAIKYFNEHGEIERKHYKLLEGRVKEEEELEGRTVVLPKGNQEVIQSRWEGVASLNKWENIGELKETKPASTSSSDKWRGVAALKTRGKPSGKATRTSRTKSNKWKKYLLKKSKPNENAWKPIWRQKLESGHYN